MSKPSPIAVVGVSSIFPGSPQVSGFWRDILQGKDQIREIPENYWLIDDYYDKNPQAEDKTYGRRGAFIESVAFDCIEHGILPSQMQDIDTVQLLALVAAQHVLRDAAKGDYKHLDKSRMSVILGVAGGTEQLVQMGARLQKPVWLKSLREAGIAENLAQDICQRIADHYVPWSEASFPGLLGNVVAGRIANRLDLGGTNCVVDAACASSCSALAMAVNELHLGHSDFVITGGADALNDILMYMCFSKTPALSATGDCRPFSDAADGTILGEGVGMLALRRLEDAERDGDTIYAVIKGVGSSSDGAGTAVYAPVSDGQAKAINRAYAQAEFPVNTIELIEAHGTGTKAGDKAEFNGLNIAFDTDAQTKNQSKSERSGQSSALSSSKKQWCALGSVKSQIGHAKGAAGAAALIKAVMSLHHKVLPPTIKVNQPNPAFDIEDTPFYINTKLRPWVRDGHFPRRAGVSSFGFGGSNFHVALEEYTNTQNEPRLQMASNTHLVVAAGESRDELFNALNNTVDKLPCDADALEYIARESQESINVQQPYRLSLVVDSIEQLRKFIAQAEQHIRASGDKSFSSPSGWYFGVNDMSSSAAANAVGNGEGHGKIACLFPGQGSQYIDMCAPLATVFPAARKVWDRAESLFDKGESLSRVAFPISAFSDAALQSQRNGLNKTEWAQPAIGAASLSMWAVLQKLGLAANGFAGHSYGELTALCAAGALNEENLIATARARGQAMRDASASSSGAMAAVHANVTQVSELLDALINDAQQASGSRPVITLANINSPSQVVVSGASDAIDAFVTLCEKQDIRISKLPVSTAFHSQIVAAAAGAFSDHLKAIPFNPLQKTVYANKTAQPYPADTAQQQQLLTQQLVSPVRFQQQIEAMYAEGYRTFIEVGPGNVLTGLVGSILKGKPHTAIATDKKANNSLVVFWKALGQLTALGIPLDFTALWQDFRYQTAPSDRPKPKMALPITGINYNRVYPPKNGAQGIPAANPEPKTPPAPLLAPAESDNSQSLNNHARSQTVAPNTQPVASSISQKPAVEVPTANSEHTLSHSEDSPISNFTSDQQNEWLAAFENIQKETNETHRQFLQMSEQALAQLGQLVASGSPVSQSAYAVPPVNDNEQPQAAQAPINRAPAPSPQSQPHVSSQQHAQPVTTRPQNSAQTVTAELPVQPVVIEPVNNVDVADVMLDVVAEKTGYPREMLALPMSLENDLGIDSIKRVEILSATLDVVPNLPEVNPSDMAVLNTLEEVVQFIQRKMGGLENKPVNAAVPTNTLADTATTVTQSAPASSSSHTPVTVSSASINVNDLLMSVVAEKTGYPLEMLSLDMHLDADLGIDSIKRVEILSAATEQLESLPELDNSVMASLNTLAEISHYIKAQLGEANESASAENLTGSANPQVMDVKHNDTEITDTSGSLAGSSHASNKGLGVPHAQSDANADIQTLMLSVVAEKTGYPLDMLEPSMDLENDLGIDSIKRVEILSATLEKVPNLPEFDAASMSSLSTLAEIIEFIKKQLGSAEDTSNPSAAVVEPESQVASNAGDMLNRYELELLQLPRPNFLPHQLLQPLVVVPANSPCAQPLCDALNARGLQASVAQRITEANKAVISLSGLQKFKHTTDALAINRVLFEQACTLAPALETEAGVFIAVQNTSGDFGQSGASGVQSWSGGISGLVKTAAQEWPSALVRSIDINIEKITLAELVNQLALEIVDGGLQREVALGLHGKRSIPVSVKADALRGEMPLSDGDVVLVTGGARGVTAEAILALSDQLPLKFALLGRSPITDVSKYDHCDNDAAIMQAILADAKAAGIQMLPAELKRQVSIVNASREVTKNLHAIEARGSQVNYYPCDINNQAHIADVVKQIHAQLGPINGVVHGAGVLADKLLSGKKLAHFDAVFGTKVQGLHNLLGTLVDEPLKVICLFSSVAARAGNIGQSDYAMANEVLNRVAAWYSAENSTKVMSINWGPWESGMVTDALKQKFSQMGVGLIPLQKGAQFFVDELRHSRLNTEVVYGGMPLNKPLANPSTLCCYDVNVVASLQNLPHLNSHRVRGEIVLPVVQVVDWFRSAISSVVPSLKTFTLVDLKVLKGIVLSEPQETFTIHIKEVPSTDEYSLGLADSQGILRYSAKARSMELSEQQGGPVPIELLSMPASSEYMHFNPYKDLLFHGAHYQSITRVSLLEGDHAVAELIGADQLNWPASNTTVDQALLDGALQLALVWGQKHINQESLPLAFDSITITHLGSVAGPVRCVLQREKHDSVSTVSNIWLLDSTNTVLACIRGLRMYAVSESLR